MPTRSIIRSCAALLLSILTPLFLSGCFLERMGWGRKEAAQEADKIAIPADWVGPGVKGTPGEGPAVDEKAPEPAPSPADKTLPKQANPRNPEAIAPLAPVPAQPRTEPAAESPADFSYRNAVLSEDTAWHGEVLIEGGVTVAPQATLTVQSGTVVRFRGGSGAGERASLVVQGRIVVNGTTERPVIFRPLYEEAAAGDWKGVVLLGSGKKNLLENCRVEGAETGFDASFSTITLKNAFFSRCRSGARLQDCLVVMSGGGAGECGAGLILYDSEADIRAAQFLGNRLGIFAGRTSLSLAGARLSANNSLAMYADASRINVSGSAFTGNGAGISLAGCEGSVSGNMIAKNAAYGLVLEQSRVKVNANAIERNVRAGLRVEDGRGIAWGNAFDANGDYDLYNAGTEEFRAVGNWWGEGTADPAVRIYDRRTDESRGRVLFQPVLQARPALDVP